ncbi:MAG: hypothetical protein ACYCZT_13510 [Thiobacillus sp.]
MPTTPLLTILIPTRSRAAKLGDALASLVGAMNMKIWFVDVMDESSKY